MTTEEITLRVTESMQNDVGYGKARINTKTRATLNTAPGDIISIKGKPITTATVWRAYQGDDNDEIIRIDGLMRKNAGASIGDSVVIQKVVPPSATKILMIPVLGENQKVQFGRGIEAFAQRALHKRSLVKGDTIIVPGIALMGGALPFMVIETQPEGIVQISETTEIIVKEDIPSKPSCLRCSRVYDTMTDFVGVVMCDGCWREVLIRVITSNTPVTRDGLPLRITCYSHNINYVAGKSCSKCDEVKGKHPPVRRV